MYQVNGHILSRRLNARIAAIDETLAELPSESRHRGILMYRAVLLTERQVLQDLDRQMMHDVYATPEYATEATEE